MHHNVTVYGNTFLDDLKRSGFLHNLLHDLKLSNNPAGRRLYHKTKALLEANNRAALSNRHVCGAEYVKGKSLDFIKFRDELNIQKLNEGYSVNYREHSMDISWNFLTGFEQNIKQTPDQQRRTVKLAINCPTKEAHYEHDMHMKVLSWLDTQFPANTDNFCEHFNISDAYDSYRDKNNFSNGYFPAKTNVYDIEEANCPKNLFSHTDKMSVFCINFPDDFENDGVNKRYTRATEGRIIDVSKNEYNKINYKIHTCIWFPCLLFFVFIFCIPAVIYMHKCDKYHHLNNPDEASFYGRISTILYISGLLAALLFYCALFIFLSTFL